MVKATEVVAELQEETDKWRDRLDEALDGIKAVDSKQSEFLANVQAYRDDCDHFLDEDDLVHAFESIVWAWAWLEIGKERGILG